VFGSGARTLVGVNEAGAGAIIGAILQEEAPHNTVAIMAGPGAAKSLGTLGFKVLRGPFTDTSVYCEAERFGPDRIVVGASLGMSVEKQLISLGRTRGIPIATVIDGHVNLWQRFAGERPAERWRWVPDEVFVLNEALRERLLGYGYPPDGLIALLTSTHRRGLLLQPNLVRRRYVRRQLGVAPSTVLVTLVHETGISDDSDWNWDNPDSVVNEHMRTLVDVAADLVDGERRAGLDVRLVVKAHPTDACVRIRDDFGHAQVESVIFVNDIDRYALVAESRVVIGVGSMLLHEAAHLNPACISLKLTREGCYP